MRNILTILLGICGILPGASSARPAHDCFTPKRFQAVRDYIPYYYQHYSGTGRAFLLEYPQSKSAGDADGAMRLPSNPVYSVGIETGSGNITLENKPTIFRFHPQQGLLDSEKLAKSDKEIAHAVFCELVSRQEKDVSFNKTYLCLNEANFDRAFAYVRWRKKVAKRLSEHQRILFNGYELEAIDQEGRRIVFLKDNYKLFSVDVIQGVISHTVSKQRSFDPNELFCELVKSAKLAGIGPAHLP